MALFAAGLWAGVPEARAQYGDPLNCLPPAGQGMWEMAATNLSRRYRSDPTAENKAAMCNRFRSTVDVYDKAVQACRKSTCTTREFKSSCANARDKAAAWRKRTKEECA
jgi:hypothetical protein